MPTTIKFLLIGFLICYSTQFFGQDLVLTSGNKTKVIEAGSVVALELLSIRDTCKLCPTRTMTGKLESYKDGMVNLRLYSSLVPLVENNKVIGATRKSFKHSEAPSVSITRDSILYILDGNRNKVMEQSPGNIIGMLVFMAGTGHIISSPIAGFEKGDSGSLLLLLGIGEVLLGGALAGGMDVKPFITRDDCLDFEDGRGKRLWTIR